MSVKIRVKKRLYEGEQSIVAPATDANAQTDQQPAADAANANAAPQGDQQNAQQNDQQNAQQNNNGDASTNQNASTGIDINQFVTEVTNMYVDICTKVKEACTPDNFKKIMTLYEKAKETEPYKGKEKEFADAVNALKGVDPKNFQQCLTAFSKVVEELGKYTTAVTSAAPTTNPAVPNAQAAPAAPTTGQTTTTTTTAQAPAQNQQPAQQPAAQQPAAQQPAAQ